jgi:hypothetical protein
MTLVLEMLRNPPKWLAGQLLLCRAEPGRFLSSTASSIAAETLGSARRWPEVALVLEEHLQNGEGGAA